uniref:Fibrinogen C-terminal domain-containing protein n=1 Tax=Salmo trutta TaxID=8032 RepID=A0A674BAI7_SALTR
WQDATWLCLALQFLARGCSPREKLLRDRSLYIARSCQEIRAHYFEFEDGLYYLTTENGVVAGWQWGGWTLVASVHENNIYGKCTLGDRWTSQQGSNPFRPEGDGNWVNMNTFGKAEGATADDYKNPGYYDIKTRFLSQYGGNLYELFHRYPVKYIAGAPLINNGPSIPIVYDHGDKQTTKAFYGPYAQREFEPSFISFRAINWEWAAMAICCGTKPKGGQVDAYCISLRWPQNSVGDFTSFAWNGYGNHKGWSVSKDMLEAAVLLFYR